MAPNETINAAKVLKCEFVFIVLIPASEVLLIVVANWRYKAARQLTRGMVLTNAWKLQAKKGTSGGIASTKHDGEIGDANCVGPSAHTLTKTIAKESNIANHCALHDKELSRAWPPRTGRND
jgi:hypothetical protein